MGKTLKDLFLALLNATLILVALCLLLLLVLVNRASSLTDSLADNLRIVAPLQESVQDTGVEIRALRADLAEIRDRSGAASSATMQRIEDRVDGVQDRLDRMQTTLTELRGAPERLVDHAIAQAGEQIAITATRIRNCVPAETGKE